MPSTPHLIILLRLQHSHMNPSSVTGMTTPLTCSAADPNSPGHQAPSTCTTAEPEGREASGVTWKQNGVPSPHFHPTC